MNTIKTLITQSVLSLGVLALSQVAAASDLAKEKRWADQIVEFLIDGEAEWLTADGQEFLSIYTESTQDTTRGGIIVVHGSGVHPNWQDIVHPLRTRLPEQGWATLSIQMPVLHNEAEYHEYAPLFSEVPGRMKAAVQYLKDKDIDHIVIVAHSLGTTMSAYYLASSDASDIHSFVAIGMPGAREDERMNNLISLKKISIPMLDLYGSKDNENILESAGERKSAAAHNKKYSQQVVDGANHFFVNKNDELVSTVGEWLNAQKF